MLFIHPMWASESERLGKQKCTPMGYVLHVIADMLGFLGLLLLISVPAVLAFQGLQGTFTWSLLWLLALPFGVGIVSEALYQFSWWLALRKGFRYDYGSDEASWMEAGERRSFKH